MSYEIEERFRNFDYKSIKNKLKELDVKHKGSFLFKIASYKSENDNKSIRIRDEGYQITFTIKINEQKQYIKEYEVVVDNYDMIDNMIQLMGIKKHYDLHKYREIYRTKNNKTEIIFDHYPGLPPYMEIESKTEKDLLSFMKKLNLTKENEFSAGDLYNEYYGIPLIRKLETLTFDNANNVFLKMITKNKKQFIDILQQQKKL